MSRRLFYIISGMSHSETLAGTAMTVDMFLNSSRQYSVFDWADVRVKKMEKVPKPIVNANNNAGSPVSS